MDKDSILGILREHESELKAAGLLHLRLFGSVARGENTPQSDVDLLADLDDAKHLDVFTVIGIQHQLTNLLSVDVHLSLSNSLRPWILDLVAKEAIPAF